MCKYITFDISLIVAATLTETRQFFTLYNTLEDQKAFMEKEVCLSLYESQWYIHCLPEVWNLKSDPREFRHVSMCVCVVLSVY